MKDRIGKLRQAQDGLSAPEQRAYLEEAYREYVDEIQAAHQENLRKISRGEILRALILVAALALPILIAVVAQWWASR